MLSRLVGIDLVFHRRAVEPAKREIEAVGVVHRRRPHGRDTGVLAGLGAGEDRAAQIPVGQVAVDRDRPGRGHGHKLGVGRGHGPGSAGKRGQHDAAVNPDSDFHGSPHPLDLLTVIP
jgi:hypothetical protein